jgi:cation:H+ antiporter
MQNIENMAGFDALILAIGALGLGIVMLIRGGGWTIDAAVFIARQLGVSPLVVGFTIVAFGTSLPELLVSVNANFHGSPGIAIGNVLGSNIANILLVIGTTALFATIIAVPHTLIRDLTMMMLSTLLLAGLMLHGDITHMAGICMVGVLLMYVFWQYRKALMGEIVIEEVEEPEFNCMKSSLLFLLLGLLFIALGAEFLVRGAKVGAVVIGVPEAVIALSIIALGTSLPELSTCLIAAKKQQTDLILGNIIGSNVFNVLMIIGVTAAVKPIEMSGVASQLTEFDIWVVLAISFLFTLILLLHRKIGRVWGMLFLGGYVVYVLAIYAQYLI